MSANQLSPVRDLVINPSIPSQNSLQSPNDTEGLELDLIVECNRPKRNEAYIAWLKSVLALAIHANQRLKELEQ